MKKLLYTILFLVTCFYSIGQTTVTIGSSGGSDYHVSLSSFYGYIRNANLYTAAEVGATGISISSIQVNVQASSSNAIPLRVLMKTTASSSLTADTWANTISGATEVFNSSITAPNATGWKTITLSTPYTYSSDNLIILIECNYGGTGSGLAKTYYTTASNKHLQIYQDNSAPTGSMTLNGNRADVKITYTSAAKAEPTNQPTSFAVGTATTSNIPLTWVAAVSGAQAPDGYLIKLKASSAPTDPVDGTDPANSTAISGGVANVESASTSYSSFTNFAAGTMYYFNIYSYTNSSTSIDFKTGSPPSIYAATLPNVVTSPSISGTASTTATISWSAATGYDATNNSTLVFIKSASSVTTGTPSNAPGSYTANTVFSSGTAYQNDAAAYCVYKGDGTSVNVTGLTANTTYYILVYTLVDAANSDASRAYSTAVTANGTTPKAEPTNHPTVFATSTVAGSTIALTWTDASAGVLPDNYLIKWNSTSYASITAPSDGTAEADASGVLNISQGVQTGTATALNPNTTYYFKIWPYTNSGTTINYKTDGTILFCSTTTLDTPSSYGFTIAGNFVNNGTLVQTNDANYFAMTGASKTLSGSGTYTDVNLNVNGTITYDGTGTSALAKTYITSTKTLTINDNRSYYNTKMLIAGTLVISATSANIYNAGDWTNNGTFTANTTSNVTFNGSSSQTIGGTTTSSFYNATMNNTSGGVTLGIATTITKTLTLTSGKLYTAAYTLTLGTTSANATVLGGSSSSYVVAYDNSGTIGTLKHFVNSNAAYTYPIGDASYYTPLTFTLTSNAGLASAYYTVYTKPVKVPGLSTTFTTYLKRFWEGTSSGMTTPIYSLSYTYDDLDIVGTEANLLPIKKSGATWYKPTGSSFTTGTAQGTGSVNVGGNTLTWTGLSTFSYNGGAGSQAVGLPIQLISFTGEKLENTNLLIWNTASEINNDYFTIEKTIDGNNYQIVGTINGAGNSNILNDYQLYDYTFDNVINYYRLKQTDFNGNYTYAQEVSIDNRENESNLKTIVLITNILGQEVNETYKGLVIISYSDGSSMKVIR